jgi:hypothetical protein
MKSIVLNIPDVGNLLAFDFSIYLAAKLYEDAILSAGQTSDVANLSKDLLSS